jgi:hypothetical protein
MNIIIQSNLAEPGVNYINVLQTAFRQKDPKSAKTTVKLSVFFVLLGSAHIQAARRMMKLAPVQCHALIWHVIIEINIGICYT